MGSFVLGWARQSGNFSHVRAVDAKKHFDETYVSRVRRKESRGAAMESDGLSGMGWFLGSA